MTYYECFYTEALEARVKTLVAEKDDFDRYGRRYKSVAWKEKIKGFLGGMVEPKRGWTAVTPSKFIEAALPFSEILHCKAKAYISMVSSDLIVSGTYKDYSPCLCFEPRPEKDLMSWSDSLHGSASCKHEAPRVTKIGKLPLFVATEGKNRVEVFKKNNRPMKVLVTEMPYPSSDELVLYRSFPFGKYTLQYDKQRRVLPFPEVIVPLLVEYGVAQLKARFSIWDFVRFIRIKQRICGSQMRP